MRDSGFRIGAGGMPVYSTNAELRFISEMRDHENRAHGRRVLLANYRLLNYRRWDPDVNVAEIRDAYVQALWCAPAEDTARGQREVVRIDRRAATLGTRTFAEIARAVAPKPMARALGSEK